MITQRYQALIEGTYTCHLINKGAFTKTTQLRILTHKDNPVLSRWVLHVLKSILVREVKEDSTSRRTRDVKNMDKGKWNSEASSKNTSKSPKLYGPIIWNPGSISRRRLALWVPAWSLFNETEVGFWAFQTIGKQTCQA